MGSHGGRRRGLELPRKIISRELLSIPEVKEIFEKIKDRIGVEAFDHFQEATYEYVMEFSKISPQLAKKISKTLVKEFNLAEETAVQICNIFPRSVPELRTIVLKDPNSGKGMSDEDLAEVLNRINELEDEFG
ncbi:MAG: hypothetical protein Kow0069_35420 [Promethearchaeota archaeon]